MWSPFDVSMTLLVKQELHANENNLEYRVFRPFAARPNNKSEFESTPITTTWMFQSKLIQPLQLLEPSTNFRWLRHNKLKLKRFQNRSESKHIEFGTTSNRWVCLHSLIPRNDSAQITGNTAHKWGMIYLRDHRAHKINKFRVDCPRPNVSQPLLSGERS